MKKLDLVLKAGEFEYVPVSDNHKKWVLILLTLINAKQQGSKVDRSKAMVLHSSLMFAYPIFFKNENGDRVLHLVFSKKDKIREHSLRVSHIEDLVNFLKKVTKKEFLITTGFFLPGHEKNFKDELQKQPNMDIEIKRVAAEAEVKRKAEQERLRKIQEAEEELQRQLEEEAIRLEQELLEKQKEEIAKKYQAGKRELIDPFGDGFLAPAPKGETPEPQPEPESPKPPVKEEQPKSKGYEDFTDKYAGLLDEELPF